MKVLTFPYLIYGRVPYLRNKEYVYNIFNRQLLVEDRILIGKLRTSPNNLQKKTINKLLALGFLYRYGKASVFRIPKPDVFTVWLHLTNLCNLNCPYCFVKKQKPELIIPNNTLTFLDKIIKNIKNYGYTKIKIKYSGGEPLLPIVFERLKKIHAGLLDLSKSNSIKLEEVIISNGTLLNLSIMKYLEKMNIGIAISLDGWKESHNKTRSTIGGRPTFKTILKNINMLMRFDINFNISVVVNKYNLLDIPKLLEWAYDRPVPISVKLNFVRDNPLAQNSVVPSSSDLIMSLKKAYRIATKIIIRRKHNPILLNALLDYIDFSYPKNFTCEAGRSYMVLKADGTMSTCHMRINNKDANIKNITNIFNEFKKINIPKRVTVDEKVKCKKCPIRYICGGGCPILTKYIYKTYNHPSFYCEVYRELAPFLLGHMAYAFYKLNNVAVS